MKTTKGLLLVQPILTAYREPLIKGLSKRSSSGVLVCADRPSSAFGDLDTSDYDFIEASWKSFGPFRWLPFKVFSKCLVRSNKIIHFADFKYLSLWCYLIVCLISERQIWLHGQGGYKKSGFLHRCAYILSIMIADGYICYTKYSSERLMKVLPSFLHKKISIADNTLYLEPVVKPAKDISSDIFYIGRLREGCGLEVLLEAASEADVYVRVIGEGERSYLNKITSTYKNVKLYGPIFEREKQLVVAGICMAGVYGGDAGLSVVHYMAFGLPVIVHSSIDKHMGPEPSYVKDTVNGLTFERGDVASLTDKILLLKADMDLRNRLAEGALKTFHSLQSPTMDEKFAKILGLY